MVQTIIPDTDWQENVAKGEPLFYDVLKTEHKFTHVPIR